MHGALQFADQGLERLRQMLHRHQWESPGRPYQETAGQLPGRARTLLHQRCTVPGCSATRNITALEHDERW
jgi:hypothetical protein